MGLSAEIRDDVDDLVEKALAAGAEDLGEAQDDGFMYMRGFRDLDGGGGREPACSDSSVSPLDAR